MPPAGFRTALAAYKQAVGVMADLGYDGTRTAQALLHDWGLETILAGRPSEGEQIISVARSISAARVREMMPRPRGC